MNFNHRFVALNHSQEFASYFKPRICTPAPPPPPPKKKKKKLHAEKTGVNVTKQLF